MTHPDALQPPSDVSETMVVQVFDEISVWAHCGRMTERLWENIVVVMDGDRVLMHRGFGDPVFVPETPGSRWRLQFDGFARPTTEAELREGPLADGLVEHLEVDLLFEGVHEAFGGATEDQTWAKAHFDQGGRITGTAAGRRIDGAGFRDHSYGPRDYSRIVGDTWVTAVFESGRALLGINVWQDGPTHAAGFLLRDGVLEPVVPELPRLSSTDGSPLEWSVVLGGEEIRVQQHASFTMTFTAPLGFVMGALVGQPPIITEGPATITWGGEEAAGWVEKSLRPSELPH